MKGVIFSGFLFAVATPALAASLEQPLVLADLEKGAAQPAEINGENRREALLQEAKRRQSESLLQRQVYQLELLRRQAARDAARARKLQQLKEGS